MPLVEFVAFSLLPVRRWRIVAAELRAGRSPSDVLESEHATLSRGGAASVRWPSVASMRLHAREVIERAARVGLEPLTTVDARFPASLAAIVDPPPVLWLRGTSEVLHDTSVAIVGSRAGSPYALAVAERLAADLSARGVSIVSGMARGVDAAAHRGALSSSGRTVAVLGCGVDVAYPSEHRALAGEIASRGAVVSELVPGTPPKAWLFPQRNRIISGLSRATIVIEAGEKSGSLITARCALEQGRDVLAVPGNVLNGRNRGGHALLRDGAAIVETADDVIAELGLAANGLDGARAAGGRQESARADTADPIWAALDAGETCDLDEISERTGLPASRLLPGLFELEMKGLVKRVGGGQFVRFDSSC